MRPLKTPLLVFLLLSALLPAAQFNSLKFITYTTEDGLADNYVVKTAMDAKGFLWIATRNGLSRFDGLQFTNYTVDNPKGNGLRSMWITDLVVDKQGTLWVSTEWGVCYYDEPSNSFHYLNNKNDLVILYKAPMYVDGDFLWIASESGLKKINTTTKILTATSLGNIPDPQCIGSDDERNIWIGTRGHGIYTYTVSNDKGAVVFLPSLSKGAHVMGFYKDKKGLWAATSDGLLLASGPQSSRLFTKAASGLQPAPIEALTFVVSFPAITGDSLLICGAYNKQVSVFNKNTGLFAEVFSGNAAKVYGLPNSILNNAESSLSILWMATDKGLVALNMQRQDYTSYLFTEAGEGWEKTMVKKIMVDPKDDKKLRMLINNPGGLAEYNTATNKMERVWHSPRPGIKYRTLLADKQHNFWLIRDKGVDRFSTHTGITQLYNVKDEVIFSAAFDDRNNLWLGTGDGLIKYNIALKKAENYPCHFKGTEIENHSFPSPFQTMNVCPDNRGKVWLTSGKYGLFSFDEETKFFTPFRQPSGAAYETKNRCSALAFDKQGKLWVSNMSGLTAFDTTLKTFTNYNRRAGLLSAYIYDIGITEKGTIAGRGNSGIFQYDIAEKKFINYPAPLQMSTGILEQQISILDDKAMVGFEGGFSIYNFKRTSSPSPLPVYLLGCSVNGEGYPLAEQLKPADFTYQQNDLQLEFACVNFNQPKEITYNYRLSGVSEQWLNAGTQRTILFTNLAAGRYVFSVVAVNADGTISQHPAEFSFTIHPPFWETTLFRIGLAVIIITLVWFGFYSRIKKIKKTEAQKTAINKNIADLEMKALRSQMNPHFIFNSLNSIQKYIWEAKQEDAAEYLTKFARLIRSILENSAFKTVPLQNEISSLKLYIELEHRRSNHKFDYTFSIEESIDVSRTQIPPLLLQPYIENAIWHGLNAKKEHGQLTVSLSNQRNNLTCIVDDNGIGRRASLHQKQQGHTSMGLNISHQRIQLMKVESGIEAHVEVIDKTDAGGKATGTKIIIQLPLILQHA